MAVKLLTQTLMLVLMLLFIKQASAKNQKNTNKSAAKPACQASCGNLTISYPFGIGEKCAASKAMVISCNNSFSPPKAFLRDKDFRSLEVLNISLEAGTIHINFPVITDCTNTKNDLASHQVRLELPLTFSNNDNRYTAMGCDNLALLSSPEDSSQPEAGGCLARCNPSLKKDNSCFGINCCQTKFQQSLTSVKPSVSNGSLSSSGCSLGPRYAFIADQKWFAKLEDIYSVQTMEAVPAVLNWKPFGACQTFIQSDPIKNRTMCGQNALCTNQSLCSCSQGYEGNPYLPNGCLDIDECGTNIPASPRAKKPRQTPRAPKNLNLYHLANSPPKSQGPALPGSSLESSKCDHYCTNTPGSYTCSCQDGWLLVDKSKCVEVIYNITKKAGHRGTKAAVLVTAATCAGVGVILVVTWYLYQETRRRSIRRLGMKFFKMNGGQLLLQKLSSSQENAETTKLFTAKELDMATNHYNEDRIVGQGGKRTVYKGMLADGRIVAVKKSKIEDKRKMEQFVNEVAALSQIKHRNVVKLYGCCLETEVPLLVYEFIPNGALMEHIHEDNEYFSLTWDVRVRVATEIAEALCHLHSGGIYHRDIKSTNILFDDKYRAKVADFGISASLSIDQKVADFETSTAFSDDQKVSDLATSTSISNDQASLTTRPEGTFSYLDPEYFRSRQFTDKSDVYSFGVVLVELLTGQEPILAATLDDEARGLATLFVLAMEENRIFDIVDSRIINEEKKEEMIAFADIAYKCLNLTRRKRPTMREVAEELKSIRNTRESPTAEEGREEVENDNNELDGTWGSEGTSSSLKSTIYENIKASYESLL